MKVNEIFYSIQGESSFAGLPCVFVRFAGCNLRCSYCDTEYAFNEGHEMSTSEIMHAIGSFPAKLVLVTGGEPMLQQSIHDLFRALLEAGYEVCLETGGHISLASVDPRVHKIMDFKCPSSGMEQHNNFDNIQYLSRRDEVKFVVGGRRDFDWSCDIIRRFQLPSLAGSVLFSPVYAQLPYAQLAHWVLESGLPVRMQLQLHKIIWPAAIRGV